MKRITLVTLCGVAALAAATASAQAPVGAAALDELVRGLGPSPRVLVIGAHPDDDDAFLLTWLSRGHQVETAYLSLTRGEGGQNLIGGEQGDALGMVRTEEALAARRIDGAHQYFTRAMDFGYSKTFAETDSLWPHERILKDVVTVIRAFRPHVIVSVWSGTAADGHGQHQFAAVMAREAFVAAAGDPRFPSQVTSGLTPWSVTKLYHRVRPDTAAVGRLRVNVGEYDVVSGRSYAEIAAVARSQHRTQGLGTVALLGPVWTELQLDTSRVSASPDGPLFEGVDTTWARIPAASIVFARARPAFDSLPDAIRAAQAALSLIDPTSSIAPMARVVRLARAARDGTGCTGWLVPQCPGARGDAASTLNTTLDRATQALLLAAGVTVEVTAAREQVATGDTVSVTVSVHNRGRRAIDLMGGHVVVEGNETDLRVPVIDLAPDSVVRIEGVVVMQGITYPWWAVNGIDLKQPTIYDFKDGPQGIVEQLVTGEDRIAVSRAMLTFRLDSTTVVTSTPIVHRFADPIRGEQRRPLVGVPRVSTAFQRGLEYVRAKVPMDRVIRVEVHSSWSAVDTINVSLIVPPGIRVDSAARRVILPAYGSTAVFFRVRGTVEEARYLIGAATTDRAGGYRTGFIDIEYFHIRPIRYFRPPELTLSAVDVQIPAGLEVAYVEGVGDEVEPMLEQLGVKIHNVRPDAMTILDPATVHTLVLGPRAADAVAAVASSGAFIQDFARRGGTVVMQFLQDPSKPGMLPYPVTLAEPVADRVTDEKAVVTRIDSMTRVLRSPNVIRNGDFQGWFQERAVYVPRAFAAQYTPLLEMHDRNEAPLRGTLLVAPVGRGQFIYTSLSFFRQLPSGNPGAARLFVNLMSIGVRAAPSRQD